MAWILALLCSLGAAALQSTWTDAGFSTAVGALISLPAAVVGLLVAILNRPVSFAIAVALAPVLYRWCRNILQKSWSEPCSGSRKTSAIT